MKGFGKGLQLELNFQQGLWNVEGKRDGVPRLEKIDEHSLEIIWLQ